MRSRKPDNSQRTRAFPAARIVPPKAEHLRSPSVDLQLRRTRRLLRGRPMNGLIYLIGLIVVIMFILSILGLR